MEKLFTPDEQKEIEAEVKKEIDKAKDRKQEKN